MRQKLLRTKRWTLQDIKAIHAIEKQVKGISDPGISCILNVGLFQVLDRYPELDPVRQDIQPIIKEQHNAWKLEKLPSPRAPATKVARSKSKKSTAEVSSQGSEVSPRPSKEFQKLIEP